MKWAQTYQLLSRTLERNMFPDNVLYANCVTNRLKYSA